MELFNLDGTIKESFSIGSGTKKIEIRSFNGKLFYRNYGDAWREITSGDSKVKPWSSQKTFQTGELVSYSGSLWLVLEDHISDNLFNLKSDKYGRIGNYDGLTIFDIAVSNQLAISTETTNKIIIQGNGTTAKTILLPNAQNFQIGTIFEIQNDSNSSVSIKKSDASSFAEIGTSGFVALTLIDNSTALGTWTFYDFTIKSGLNLTTIRSNNYNANTNEVVLCNTFDRTFTVTLPLNPADGDIVAIMDVRGTFKERPVTLGRNGKKIQNFEDDWELDIGGTYMELFYSSLRGSWYFKEVPAGSSGITPYDIYNNIAPKESPTINSFSVDTPIREFGNVINTINPVVFTVNCFRGTDPITGISFIDVDDEEVLETITEDVEDGGTFTYSYGPNTNVSTDNIYKVIVSDNNLVAETTTSIQFASKIHWGFSANATLTSAQVLALQNNLLQTSVENREYAFGTHAIAGGAYIYFAYPSTFSTLVEIEDTSNGIVYNASAFTSTLQNVTNSFGILKQYRVYRTNIKTFGGSFNWKVYLS